MHLTLCSSPPLMLPSPRSSQSWLSAQIFQQHCLETNKILQWAQPLPQLPPLPWLCPAVGSMSSVSTVSHWPPSLS